MDPLPVHRQDVPRQNVPRDKTSQGTKRPKGQNVPRTKCPKDKTSQGTKGPKRQNKKEKNSTFKFPIFQKQILSAFF